MAWSGGHSSGTEPEYRLCEGPAGGVWAEQDADGQTPAALYACGEWRGRRDALGIGTRKLPDFRPVAEGQSGSGGREGIHGQRADVAGGCYDLSARAGLAPRVFLAEDGICA